MDLPAFSSFDRSRPQTFYLGRDDEFAGLADAEIVAQDGSKLPVHSQVVSIHSRVLKGLFAAVRDGCTSGAADEAVSLKDCFVSFSLYSVAAFLRFCYQPEDACKENFKQLDDEICSVVRLAHQLDCPGLQSKLEKYLSNTVDCLDVKGAVCWARLAEDCKLNKLRVQALRQAALALIKPPGGFNTPYGCGANSRAAASGASEVASTSALKDLSQESLLAVLSVVVAAGRRVNITSYVPATADLLSAMSHLQ